MRGSQLSLLLGAAPKCPTDSTGEPRLPSALMAPTLNGRKQRRTGRSALQKRGERDRKHPVSSVGSSGRGGGDDGEEQVHLRGSED